MYKIVSAVKIQSMFYQSILYKSNSVHFLQIYYLVMRT